MLANKICGPMARHFKNMRPIATKVVRVPSPLIVLAIHQQTSCSERGGTSGRR